MKTSNILIFGALAAGALWFLGRKTLAKSVRFSIEQIKLNGTKLELQIGILNPTKQKALLSGIVADVNFRGNTVSTIEYYNPVVIAPLAKTKINLTVTPNALGILSTLVSAIKKKDFKTIQANITGTATIDNTAIPLNINYNA
jgi:LEA14-like dessication related protein